MSPILYTNFEYEPPGVQIGDNRIDAPVPVPVDDVPLVALRKQLRIQARVVRPGARMRAHADITLVG